MLEQVAHILRYLGDVLDQQQADLSAVATPGLYRPGHEDGPVTSGTVGGGRMVPQKSTPRNLPRAQVRHEPDGATRCSMSVARPGRSPTGSPPLEDLASVTLRRAPARRWALIASRPRSPVSASWRATPVEATVVASSSSSSGMLISAAARPPARRWCASCEDASRASSSGRRNVFTAMKTSPNRSRSGTSEIALDHLKRRASIDPRTASQRRERVRAWQRHGRRRRPVASQSEGDGQPAAADSQLQDGATGLVSELRYSSASYGRPAVEVVAASQGSQPAARSWFRWASRRQ